jgi:hypothetical protein
MTAYEDMGPRAFIASVLWIHGRSIGEVANVVQWTSGQMRGFVTRQFKVKAREHMTYEERAAELEAMKAVRQDGGRLRDEHFKPIPIQGKPAPKPKPISATRKAWAERLAVAEQIVNPDRRQAEIAHCNTEFRAKLQKMHEDKEEGGLDLSTKVGRKQARILEGEITKMVREMQRAAEAREAGLNPSRGVKDSALDYLDHARLLRDAGGHGDKQRSSEESRRLEAGMRLRRFIEGTRVGNLGALDYERATMGGGGSSHMTPTEYRLRCTYALGEIRQMMSSTDYTMIEAVADQDIFIWERAPAGTKTRANIFTAIRQLLDIVAVHENLMTSVEYTGRWDETLPIVDRRKDAREHAEAIAEFMEAAR